MVHATQETGGAVPPPRSGRTACLLIPDFHAAVRVRHDPGLAGRPFAVVAQGSGSTRATGSRQQNERDRITAVSKEARAARVKPGLTVVSALAVCPELELLPHRDDLLEQAVVDLLTALRSVSPRLEPAGDGLVYLDPRGLDLIHGSELQLLARMIAGAGQAGFAAARAAVGGGRFVAFAAAACGPTEQTIVAAGEERAFLAPLPLELLPLSERNRERLHSLGLQTLGELAELPAASVEVRYDAEGVRAWRLARGWSAELLSNVRETETIAESFDLEYRIQSREQLQPVLEQLLDRLLLRIQRTGGRGVLLLLADLLLDDDSRVEVAAEPAAPTVEKKTLLSLLSLELGRTAFAAPVIAGTLRVLALAPREASQGRLFARRRTDPGRLSRALSRLRALFGDQALLRITLRESHRPEARNHSHSDAKQAPQTGRAGRAGRAPLLTTALRLIEPPRAIRVRLVGGRIAAFSLGGQPPLTVRLRFGPRRVSGDWWREPFDRDYFQVATADRGLYWLFRDLRENRWYLHGVFD